MSKTLAFTERDLQRAADTRSYERGLAYIDSVCDLDFASGEITATVVGNADYDVVLTLDDEGLTGDCSCPHGREGNFCKHCVAVGLAVLSEAIDVPSRRASGQAKAQSLDGWLAALTREELLDLVRQQIAEDRDLRRRLELRAASADSDVVAIRARIKDLLDTRGYGRHGYIEYSEASGYADRIGEVVTALEALIEAGNAQDAVGVARDAIELLTDAYGNVDDSSGSVGAAVGDVLAVHWRACLVARPDPVALGDYLADKLLLSSDLFEVDIEVYSEALGATGLARVRERVTDAWSRNPSGWVEKHLMESLVRADGDVDVPLVANPRYVSVPARRCREGRDVA